MLIAVRKEYFTVVNYNEFYLTYASHLLIYLTADN